MSNNTNNLWYLARDNKASGGWIVSACNSDFQQPSETYTKYKIAQAEALKRNSNEILMILKKDIVTDFGKDEEGNAVFWLGSDYEEDYQEGYEGWLLCDNVPFKASAEDFVIIENDDGELILKPTQKLLAIKKYLYFNIEELPDNVQILDSEYDHDSQHNQEYIDDKDSQYDGSLPDRKYVGDSNYSPLLSIVAKDLYRKNPFRILGLPINASLKEINRKQKSIEMSIDLGTVLSQSIAGILPLEPSPDKDCIKIAVEQIRDPHVRLIYGLFWFWQSNHSKDECLELLHKRKFNEALKYWHDNEGNSNSGSIAKHNMAVLYHLTALDLEDKIVNGTAIEKEIESCKSHWKSAYTRWFDLVETDFFGDCIIQCLEDIDDVRLTLDVVNNIRHTLPKALLNINAELAVDASYRCDSKEVKRHIDIMNASGFDDRIIQEVLRDVTKPIIERIHSVCVPITEKSKKTPREANSAVKALLSEIKLLLQSLDLLIPSDSSLKERCHDEVAATLRDGIVTYGNETADWKECLDLSHEAANIAVGKSIKDRISDDIVFLSRNLQLEEEQKKVEEEHQSSINTNAVYEVVVVGNKIAVPPLCTCCLKEADRQQSVSYSWTEQKTLSKVERTVSFNFPVCRECEKHQGQLTTKRFLLIILSSLLSVGLLYMIGSESSRFEYIEYIIPGAIISLVTLVVLSFLLRVRKITDEHAARNEAVTMVNANSDLNYATFRFSNYLYALAFAKANNREIKKQSRLRYSRNRSLLRGRSAFQVFIWVAILSLIGHSIAYSVLDDSWTSKSSFGTSTYSRPSSSYSRPSYNYSQDSGTLISQINAGKQNLRTIEIELEKIDSSMESLSSRINSLKLQIDQYESAAANGQYVNQYSYNSVIENHNKLVNEYNSVLSKRKIKYSEYEQEFKRVNGLIERYNRR